MNETLALHRPAPPPSADETPMEIEVKLAATPAMMEHLRSHPLLGIPGKRDAMVTVYFDTPSHHLAKAGASLRLRCNAKGCEQTLKLALRRKSHIQRGEWNHPLPNHTDTPDPAAFPPLAANVLTKLLRKQTLARYAEVTVERESRIITYGASQIEVAFDTGSINVPGQPCATVAEVELELITGEVSDLLALALELPLGPELQWSLATKAQRARALAEGGADTLSPPALSPLSPDMTAARGFQAIGWSALTQLLGHASQVISRGDPVAIHQARVTIRRLRAGFALFSRSLFRTDAQARLLRAQLRDAAKALAPARDRHVLRRRLIETQAVDETALARLAKAEDDATADARKALAAKGFQSMLLRLAHWLESGAWLAQPDAATPLPPLAAKLLERQRDRIKGMRRRLAGMSDPALHDLRIEVKKMRYATEYFAPLSPDSAAACAHGEALAQVQDALGDMQDLAQAEEILAQAFDDAELTDGILAAMNAKAPPRQDLIARARRHLATEKAKAGWWRALNPINS